MGLIDTITTLSKLPLLLKTKKELTLKPLDTKDCLAAQTEAVVAKFPHRPAIVFEGKTLTWHELNQAANRYAHSFLAQGIGHGDTVSVFMDNRIEYLVTLLGLSKIGAVGALINNNLQGTSLVHCVTIANSKKLIFGAELSQALEEAKAELPLEEGRDYLFVPDTELSDTPNWALNMAEISAGQSDQNLPQTANNRLGDNSLYIYTSGTTGLPKAAVLSNRRHLTASRMAAIAGFRATEKDAIYVCLPMYHGTGLMLGIGAALLSGAKIILRRRFSASNFLPEVREHGATCLIYIGELCRYLMNTKALPNDADNPLRKILGNGLRPDIWMDFKKRYDIKLISEFYGASEGNVSMVNLLNKNCTVGMTSQEVCLVQYDVDEDVIKRDANGFAIPASAGEPGLMLGKITENTVFEGYTDKAATDGKVERNLLGDGDAWFNSGDLMKTVDVGYTIGYPHYQFVDRVGDTFRWKSENVSTNEVGEIINGHPQVKVCNVYGVEVPGADGRAGMAAITLEQDGELDLADLSKFVSEALPVYACPVFLRIQPELDVTGTFKLLKTQLKKDGYNVSSVTDAMYVRKPHTTEYVALDADYYATIRSGGAGF